MTHLSDQQSSDEVAASRRLTGRDVASAWSMALLGLAGLALVSLAVDPTLIASGQDPSSCWRAVLDVTHPH